MNYYSYRFRVDENDENNRFMLQPELRFGGEERASSEWRSLGRTLLPSLNSSELSVHLLREGYARERESSGGCVVPSRKQADIAPKGEEGASELRFRLTFVGLLRIGLVDELLRVLREAERSNAMQHGGILGVLE